MPGDFTRGFRHAMPAKAKPIAMGFHHPRGNEGVQQRTGQSGIDHGPNAETASEQQRAENDTEMEMTMPARAREKRSGLVCCRMAVQLVAMPVSRTMGKRP